MSLVTVKFRHRALAPAATMIALCGLLTGCSSFEKRVVAVESRQSAIEAQIADLQTAQENIVARLVQVRQELDNALRPLRTQSADRGQDLRSMVREVTALEEQIVELDDRISRLSEQVATGERDGASGDRNAAAAGSAHTGDPAGRNAGDDRPGDESVQQRLHRLHARQL